MKKIILLCFLLSSFGMNAFSQEKPIQSDTILPEKVVKTFKEKYAGKSDSLWVKNNDIYVITFTSEGKWYDVSIGMKGNWMETTILINYEDLPTAVKSVFEKSEYATFEQLKVDQIETEKLPLIYRLILLSKAEDEIVIKYDPQGQVVR